MSVAECTKKKSARTSEVAAGIATLKVRCGYFHMLIRPLHIIEMLSHSGGFCVRNGGGKQCRCLQGCLPGKCG